MTSHVVGLPHHVIGPHILLIMADQLAAPLLALHGGPDCHPNINRLAEQGSRSARHTRTVRCVHPLVSR